MTTNCHNPFSMSGLTMTTKTLPKKVRDKIMSFLGEPLGIQDVPQCAMLLALAYLPVGDLPKAALASTNFRSDVHEFGVQHPLKKGTALFTNHHVWQRIDACDRAVRIVTRSTARTVWTRLAFCEVKHRDVMVMPIVQASSHHYVVVVCECVGALQDPEVQNAIALGSTASFYHRDVKANQIGDLRRLWNEWEATERRHANPNSGYDGHSVICLDDEFPEWLLQEAFSIFVSKLTHQDRPSIYCSKAYLPHVLQALRCIDSNCQEHMHVLTRPSIMNRASLDIRRNEVQYKLAFHQPLVELRPFMRRHRVFQCYFGPGRTNEEVVPRRSRVRRDTGYDGQLVWNTRTKVVAEQTAEFRLHKDTINYRSTDIVEML